MSWWWTAFLASDVEQEIEMKKEESDLWAVMRWQQKQGGRIKEEIQCRGENAVAQICSVTHASSLQADGFYGVCEVFTNSLSVSFSLSLLYTHARADTHTRAAN